MAVVCLLVAVVAAAVIFVPALSSRTALGSCKRVASFSLHRGETSQQVLPNGRPVKIEVLDVTEPVRRRTNRKSATGRFSVGDEVSDFAMSQGSNMTWNNVKLAASGYTFIAGQPASMTFLLGDCSPALK